LKRVAGKFESSAGIKAKRKLRETHYFEQNMFVMEDDSRTRRLKKKTLSKVELRITKEV
jgi:hypothetical protein